MKELNSFKNYQRAVRLLLSSPNKCLVFNSRIGWVVTGEHISGLDSDIVKLSKVDIKAEAMNGDGDPESVETWANLTTKHNINP